MEDKPNSSFTVKLCVFLLCELPISCDKKGKLIQNNQAHLISQRWAGRADSCSRVIHIKYLNQTFANLILHF